MKINDILKNYWWVIIVIILLTTNVFSFLKVNNAQKLLNIARTSNEAQIRSIEKAHEEQMRRQREIMDNHLYVIKELAKKYDEAQRQLDKKYKKKVRTLRDQLSDDPEKVSQKIKETYGFEEVK